LERKEGIDLNDDYWMHLWNFHNETPLYNQYMLIKTGNRKKENWFGSLLKI
jgi:hypothetical protein